MSRSKIEINSSTTRLTNYYYIFCSKSSARICVRCVRFVRCVRCVWCVMCTGYSTNWMPSFVLYACDMCRGTYATFWFGIFQKISQNALHICVHVTKRVIVYLFKCFVSFVCETHDKRYASVESRGGKYYMNSFAHYKSTEFRVSQFSSNNAFSTNTKLLVCIFLYLIWSRSIVVVVFVFILILRHFAYDLVFNFVHENNLHRCVCVCMCA